VLVLAVSLLIFEIFAILLDMVQTSRKWDKISGQMTISLIRSIGIKNIFWEACLQQVKGQGYFSGILSFYEKFGLSI